MVFQPFRLDRPDGRLWRGTDEIVLRPKTFAVLSHLVEHAGRLVTRDDLVHAVWRGAAGAAELPRGCIRELRRALGDDASSPRLIETVGRHGYRFIAPVEAAAAIAPPGAEIVRPASAAMELLVGREAARAELERALGDARDGTCRVVFITGEPGIGKSALLDVLLEDIAAAGLLVARGQCVEHYGGGDPYYPLLEALARLGRSLTAEPVVDALARHAPTWITHLPGLTHEHSYAVAARRARGATPDRMRRELADALEVLTSSIPLVLALDDLQWADPATVSLLPALVQGRGAARLLVVGTYRPADLLASDHPLKLIKEDLQARGLCDELPLGLLDARHIATYLAARFPGNRFPPALPEAIHALTGGNPLFMVNVLADLVARGRIAAGARGWELRGKAADVEAEVPESLRQLIDLRLQRAPADALAVLEAASVAGNVFGALVIAPASGLDVGQAEEQCEELAREAHFLAGRGALTLPDGTITGRYEFKHMLYQKALYERIAPARRATLHRQIAEQQETRWGGRSAEIAADLAGHFERSGDPARALRYRIDAMETARRRQAHGEMMTHLMRGLDLVHRLPAGPERTRSELLLQSAFARSLTATRGYASLEVERALARARELSGEVPEPHVLFPIVRAQQGLHLVRGAFREGRDLARECQGLAEATGDPALRLEAQLAAGETAFYLGEPRAARTSLAGALRIAARERPTVPAFRAGSDPRIAAHAHLAFTRWVLGEPEGALREARLGLALAKDLGEAFGQVFALVANAIVHQLRQEAEPTGACASGAAAMAAGRGFAMFAAQATLLGGWARAAQGDVGAGLRSMREGLAAWEATGAGMARPYYLSLIAEGLAAGGDLPAACRALDEALATAARTAEGWWLAELHRRRGDLRLAEGAPTDHASEDGRARRARREAAEACFRTALEIATRQGARSLQLRAALSLARLWRRRRERARELLRDVLDQRENGGDEVADVREARSLLASLGG